MERRVLVAIDGGDASGKTTYAARLVDAAIGFPTQYAGTESINGFHAFGYRGPEDGTPPARRVRRTCMIREAGPVSSRSGPVDAV